MALTAGERVRRRREILRSAGLRPLQIWVPDTRRPGFAAACRRQAAMVAAADISDTGLLETLDAILADLGEEEA